MKNIMARVFFFTSIIFYVFSCNNVEEQIDVYSKPKQYLLANWSSHFNSALLPDTISGSGEVTLICDSANSYCYSFRVIKGYFIASFRQADSLSASGCIVYQLSKDVDLAASSFREYGVDSIDLADQNIYLSRKFIDEDGEYWLQTAIYNLNELKLEVDQAALCILMGDSSMADQEPERWESLQFVFQANAGMIGYYEDGKRVPCLKCGVCLDHFRKMDSSTDFSTYTVSGDKLIIEGGGAETLSGLSDLKDCWDRLHNEDLENREALLQRINELKQALIDEGWVMVYGIWLVDPPDEIKYGYTVIGC